MADFASSFVKPINSAAASSSSSSSSTGALDDSIGDVCSICLEPFSTEDPSSVTNCKHEYHLQCILEWSQRSKECPICWQFLVLKNPASQELLVAVASERSLRERHRPSNASTILQSFSEDSDIDLDASDDSDFDERIMHHLAAAAASRARYVCRRGRQESSGINPSQVLSISPSADMPDEEDTYTSPEECQRAGYAIFGGDTSNSNIPSVVNGQPPLHTDPSVGNTVSSTAANRDSLKSRQLPPDSPRRSSPSELFSFSESVKARLSAASSRCKESISKGTRGFKEKLLARNNSVKELSKGVQRDMNAGVARMLERLDLTSKRSGSTVSDSSPTEGTSNFSLRGKGVQDSVIVLSQNGDKGEVVHDISPISPSYVSNRISGRPTVSHAQIGH